MLKVKNTNCLISNEFSVVLGVESKRKFNNGYISELTRADKSAIYLEKCFD